MSVLFSEINEHNTQKTNGKKLKMRKVQVEEGKKLHDKVNLDREASQHTYSLYTSPQPHVLAAEPTTDPSAPPCLKLSF